MDYSLPGSSDHEVLQARILEWVAILFSRGSSWSRDWTWVSCIVCRLFTIWVTREALICGLCLRLFFFFSFGIPTPSPHCGQRSWVSYSPWVCKKSVTEWLSDWECTHARMHNTHHGRGRLGKEPGLGLNVLGASSKASLTVTLIMFSMVGWWQVGIPASEGQSYRF